MMPSPQYATGPVLELLASVVESEVVASLEVPVLEPAVLEVFDVELVDADEVVSPVVVASVVADPEAHAGGGFGPSQAIAVSSRKQASGVRLARAANTGR